MSFPILTWLVFSPLLGAVLLWLLPARLGRFVAAAAISAGLGFAIWALLAFEPGGSRFQLVERALWVPGLKLHYHLGVDGLSVLFLPATALLFLGSLVASWQSVRESPRAYYSFLLALETATLGIFCALDTAFFFVFWEFSLVPLFFLLSRWGVTPSGTLAATRYFLMMLAGGMPILIAFVILATSQPAAGFDLVALLASPLPESAQLAVFLLFLVGFGIKVPLVPLHTWLPHVALAAPGSVTALLVGLKLGAYGLIRFAIPLAPQVAQELHWLLAGLGTVAILYGAVGMLAQSNLRVGLAYASISHVGLVVLGLASFTAQGVLGAVSLLLGFSLATGGAFILLEFLRLRTGTNDVHALGGAANTMPLLSGGFLLCGLAGLGMPGTSSFVGEFMLLLATLNSHTGAGLAALFGLAITAGAFLDLYRRAFFGPVVHEAVRQASDLRPREWTVLVVLSGLILAIGLVPGPWLEIVRQAADAWAAGLAR